MTVYLKPAWRVAAKQDRVYHTKDCQHYQKAPDKSVFDEMAEEDVPDDVRICKECDGDSHRKHEQNSSQYDTLSDPDFGPDDLDMTPTGER